MTMQIRQARAEDAEAAALVLRRSISELCHADHRGDLDTLERWLANKTPHNVLRWIGDPGNLVLVADEAAAILGVAAMQSSGRISLNYVSPDARFRGVSKALVAALETRARTLEVAAITLESTATAFEFYRSLGYRDAGPAYQGFGVTMCYPMAKPLASA